jgi:hypothetical protein
MEEPLFNVEIDSDEQEIVDYWLDSLEEEARQAFLELNPRRRTCLVLHYLLRKTRDEVAHRSHITQERVRQINKITTRILRSKLEYEYCIRNVNINEKMKLPIERQPKSRSKTKRSLYSDFHVPREATGARHKR